MPLALYVYWCKISKRPLTKLVQAWKVYGEVSGVSVIKIVFCADFSRHNHEDGGIGLVTLQESWCSELGVGSWLALTSALASLMSY